jgi:type I restriction enzyme M protein
LQDFIKCYNPDNRHSLTDLDSLPDPEVLAAEIMENLETALDNFKALMTNLDTTSTNDTN